MPGDEESTVTVFAAAGVEPDIVVGNTHDLSDHGIAGTVVHTPGHTSDSLTIVLDNGELLIADLVRGKRGGLGFGLFYESVDEVRESLAALATLEARKVHMSHGEAVDGRTFLTAVEKL
jgi:glyoxylase-like metal-dependent hydrolase (beta-lactamase superfamily II)